MMEGSNFSQKGEIMDQDKKYFGKWYVWVVFLMIVTGIVLIGLSYLGIFGKTVAERTIFENSYQKKAADEDAILAYDAQIAVLQRRLRSDELTDSQRAEIQGQIDSINILKTSKGN